MDNMMTRAYLLLTANGAQLTVTSHDLMSESAALDMLAAGGPDKFIAFEIPIEEVRKNYSAHLEHAFKDPKLTNSFIPLDVDGAQVFKNIEFSGLGPPIFYEEAARVSRI
jgi:hypothetical protein